MALYSLFRFHASALVDSLERECVDDLDALDTARDFFNQHIVEVYDAERFVARVKCGDTPANIHDAPSREPVPGRFAEAAQRRAGQTAKRTRDRLGRSAVAITESLEARCRSEETVCRSKDKLAHIAEKYRDRAGDVRATAHGMRSTARVFMLGVAEDYARMARAVDQIAQSRELLDRLGKKKD